MARRNYFPTINMANLHIPPFNNTKYRKKDSKSDTSSGLPSMDNIGKNSPAKSDSSHISEDDKSHSTHFCDKEPEIPSYQGGKIKTVKIKTMDKKLFFDGSNMAIKNFIQQYKDAADTDGASKRDLAKHIIPFIIG